MQLKQFIINKSGSKKLRGLFQKGRSRFFLHQLQYMKYNRTNRCVHLIKKETLSEFPFTKMWKFPATGKPVFINTALVSGQKMTGDAVYDHSARLTRLKIPACKSGNIQIKLLCSTGDFPFFHINQKTPAAIPAFGALNLSLYLRIVCISPAIEPVCRKLLQQVAQSFVRCSLGFGGTPNLFEVLMIISGLSHFNEDTAFGFPNQKLFRTFAPV